MEELETGSSPDLDLLNEDVPECPQQTGTEPEAEDAQPTPGEQNASAGAAAPAEAVNLAVTSEVTTSAAQAEERAAAKARRSERGAVAHYQGNLLAAYVGRKVGAQRVKMFANHHELIEVLFQIRTIQGSQSTFTINLDTEPPKIIVVARNRKQANQEETKYAVYGVLLADAVLHAKKSRSPGHAKSGHQQVALSQVDRRQLGELVILNADIHAETSEQRLAQLQQIDAMDVDHQDAVIQAAREFICGEVME